MIAFGPNGKLYIGKGDGGWEGDPLNAGQRLDVHWGKLLRIDVDAPDDVPYAVPKDNPLAQANKPQLMSLFGISELEFSKIHINAKPEIWPTGCAIRTRSISTRSQVICSSPMWARTTGKRSTGSSLPPRAARTTAGSSTRAPIASRPLG